MNSYDSSIGESYEITEANLDSFLKQKTKLISSMLEGKKILDAGCGTGAVFKFLSGKDFDLSGTDYSQVLLNKAKQKNFPVKLFQADLMDKNSFKLYESYFDSIISSEVLEHLENELKALQTINYVLKPNGVLVLDVPAFSFLYSPHDKKIGHYRRYTKKSICNTIEKAGFTIESCRYWNLMGFFGWLFSFTILKKDFRAINKNLGNMLGLWLNIESKIPMPFGLTILVKARKIK